MANAIYPKYKEALLTGDANISLTTGTVKVTLIDTATYTYDAAHDFIADVVAGSRISTTELTTGKTVINGLFVADNVTFSTVSGNESEALIIWIDTTVEATSRLVAYFDTGVTGLPVIPNGGDIDISWNVSGIFQL